MELCPGSSSPFQFDDPCIRESWASLLPAAIVFLLGISSLPISIPPPLKNVLGINAFQSFLTLHEAEALDAASAVHTETEISVTAKPPLWRTVVLSTLSLLQSLAWLALASYRLITHPFHLRALLPFALALPWVYATLRPLLRPPTTPPYDLFVLFVAHLVMGALMLGGVLYTEAEASVLVLAGLSANIMAVLVCLAVVVNIPMDVPSSSVKTEDIVSSTHALIGQLLMRVQGMSVSPEDYTTLLKWITFSWVYPLIKRVRPYLISPWLC